jgi:hypothetical protein
MFALVLAAAHMLVLLLFFLVHTVRIPSWLPRTKDLSQR